MGSKNNILFIDSVTVFGGGQNYILDLVTAFQEAGFTCSIACRTGTPMQQIARENGIPVLDFPVKNRTDITSMARFAVSIKKYRFGHIFTGDSTTWYTGTVIKLIRPQTALYAIVNISTMTFAESFSPLKKRILRFVDKTWTSFYRFVIPTNIHQYNLLKGERINGKKLRLVQLGIAQKRIQDKLDSGSDGSRYIPSGTDTVSVGILGPLEPEKKIDLLLNAVPEILRSNNKVHFFVIGEGSQKEALASLTESLNVSGSVTFTGCLKGDFYALFSRLDLLVNTSTLGSFPTSVLEAMRFQIPVVTLSNPGIANMMADGETCIIAKDENSLAHSIISVLSDAGKRTEIARKANKVYKEKLVFENTFKQYLQLVQ